MTKKRGTAQCVDFVNLAIIKLKVEKCTYENVGRRPRTAGLQKGRILDVYGFV